MELDNESGQSLVEMALSLPLLVLLLLGTVELAQVCYGAIAVSNAAKAAAQYAAQNSTTAAQNPTAVAYTLLAAQRDTGSVPGLAGPLDMPVATTMPDGSALPSGTVCTVSGTSAVCSYCSCSSPNSSHPPFACGSPTATTQCVGISQLEQDIVIQTHISLYPMVTIPGLGTPFSLYGHAVAKRLQ